MPCLDPLGTESVCVSSSLVGMSNANLQEGCHMSEVSWDRVALHLVGIRNANIQEAFRVSGTWVELCSRRKQGNGSQLNRSPLYLFAQQSQRLLDHSNQRHTSRTRRALLREHYLTGKRDNVCCAGMIDDTSIP